jgi:hypothetical protein
MLGAVTVRGTARESRRTIGLMLLVVAALVEAYWAYTVPIRIPRQKHRGDSPDDIIMVCETILRSSLPTLSPNGTLTEFHMTVARRPLVPSPRSLPRPPALDPPSPRSTTNAGPLHDLNPPLQNRRRPDHPPPPPPPEHSRHPARSRAARPRDGILDARALRGRCRPPRRRRA